MLHCFSLVECTAESGAGAGLAGGETAPWGDWVVYDHPLYLGYHFFKKSIYGPWQVTSHAANERPFWPFGT